MRNWNTSEYEQYSPFLIPLGFAQNNVRFIGAEHSYQHFFLKILDQYPQCRNRNRRHLELSGIAKNLQLNGGLRFNFQGNLRLSVGFNHDLNEEFEGYNFEHLSSIRMLNIIPRKIWRLVFQFR